MLFLAVLDLHCFVRAFSSCVEWGLLFIVQHGLLLLQSTGSKHGGFSSGSTQAQWMWHKGVQWHAESSLTRGWTCVCHTGRQILIHFSIRELPAYVASRRIVSGLDCYLRQEEHYLDLWHMQWVFSQLYYSIWFKLQFSAPSTCLSGAEENGVNEQRADLSGWPNTYYLTGSQESGCRRNLYF